MTVTDSREYLIRDAFQRFYPAFLDAHPGLSPEKRKTAACIMKCKTGGLGYNVSICKDCGNSVIHAVSCNNRSCPSCQASKEKQWEAERNTELIEGIAYYHAVFTIPHEMNPLIRHNMSLLLGLFFRCVQDTLLTLCADQKFMGAKPGILSVLHTWGQTLSFHPHIHVCISGGGITPAGQFVETKHKGFFLPEAVIASMFRGKFLCALKSLYHAGKLDLSQMEHLKEPDAWKLFTDSLFKKRWLPFIKETFNGRGNAIRYLARYSYRTAIANSRIVCVDAENVTFRYKDYADGSSEKTMTVKGTDFIGMFLQHVLPSGFHRVRFSGYLTNCKKTKNLKLIHQLRNTVYRGNPYRKMKTSERILLFYGKDICSCPVCRGKLMPVPRGMPTAKLPSLLRFINTINLAMC